MWINLDDAEVALLRKLLAETAAGERRDAQLFWKDRLQDTRKEMLARADRYDALLKKIADREAGDPADEAYRGAVRTSDELEVDEDAVVSPGGDPGAWVMTWVWVTNEEAGIEEPDDEDSGDGDQETCRTCGEKYDPYGDGYDDECPDCADKTHERENPEDIDTSDIPEADEEFFRKARPVRYKPKT